MMNWMRSLEDIFLKTEVQRGNPIWLVERVQRDGIRLRHHLPAMIPKTRQ